MINEIFSVFVYKRNNGEIVDVESVGNYRVLGEKGIKKFLDEIFMYDCKGYVVGIEKYK